MINHIRTLLLNIEDLGDRSEGLPVGFVPFKYNKQLTDFLNIIIPSRLSRFYKRFLAYTFLRYIDAAGMADDMKQLDPRVTYDFSLDKGEFFQFNRTSNPKLIFPVTPKANDLQITAMIHGKYARTEQLDEFYEKFRVKQIGATNDMRVYSLDANNKVIRTYVPNSTITWTGASNTGNSSQLTLGPTGLKVSFYTGNDFTAVNGSSSQDKEWEFIAEAPVLFDVNDLFNKLETSSEIVEAMLRLPAKTDTSKYDNLWRLHYNKVYRIAGLIMAFALRADNPNNRM